MPLTKVRSVFALLLFICIPTLVIAQNDEQAKLQRVVELAEALSAGKTPEETTALLNAQPELVTPDLVKALTKLAREHIASGKHAQALTICDLALDIAKRLNDKRGMFLTLRVKGELARVRGDNKQALEYLERCLKLAEEIGDKASFGDALNSIGIVYALQSDYPKALEMFQRNDPRGARKQD
jgi:tetratricopeptide (TPR) repeat protein